MDTKTTPLIHAKLDEKIISSYNDANGLDIDDLWDIYNEKTRRMIHIVSIRFSINIFFINNVLRYHKGISLKNNLHFL